MASPSLQNTQANARSGLVVVLLCAEQSCQDSLDRRTVESQMTAGQRAAGDILPVSLHQCF